MKFLLSLIALVRKWLSMYWFIEGLKEIRKEAGLSQVQLARKSKVGLNTIKRIERGRNCNEITYKRLLSVLPKVASTARQFVSEGSVEYTGTVEVKIEDICLPESHKNELCDVDIKRIEKCHEALFEVFPQDISHWIEDFSTEEEWAVEQELKLWEEISYAYKRFVFRYPNSSKSERKEAFSYLSYRSCCSKKQSLDFSTEVLSKSAFKYIVSICKFKGIPIGVRKL